MNDTFVYVLCAIIVAGIIGSLIFQVYASTKTKIKEKGIAEFIFTIIEDKNFKKLVKALYEDFKPDGYIDVNTYLIAFKAELAKEIIKYANEHFEGQFDSILTEKNVNVVLDSLLKFLKIEPEKKFTTYITAVNEDIAKELETTANSTDKE